MSLATPVPKQPCVTGYIQCPIERVPLATPVLELCCTGHRRTGRASATPIPGFDSALVLRVVWLSGNVAGVAVLFEGVPDVGVAFQPFQVLFDRSVPVLFLDLVTDLALCLLEGDMARSPLAR